MRVPEVDVFGKDGTGASCIVFAEGLTKTRQSGLY